MNGTLITLPANLGEATLKRFQSHSQLDRSTGCILWTGFQNGRGYGVFNITIDGKKRKVLPHRLAYAMRFGEIPNGLSIDHLCRTRLCLNPEHLEPVTTAENNRRMRLLITHCPRGHEYTEANTYMHRDARYCRTCNAASRRRRTKRLKSAR